MYKKLFLLFVMTFFVIASAFGAMVYVASDSVNVLPTAISQASSGDVIVLTDVGPYLSSSQMSLDKDITVVGDPSLSSLPVLKYVGTSTSAYMFKIPGSYRLVLANLEFAGDGTGDGAVAKAKYVVTIDNGDTTSTAKLYLDNCIAHDFNDKFIKPYGSAGLDSLIVKNSTFYNGASEGIVLYSGSSSDPAAAVRFTQISNSTFHDIERECVKGDTYAYGKVIVDHITAYNCGDVDGKSMIYFDDYKDVTVKNSIFVKNSYSSYFARFESADNQFHNIAVWDVVNWTADAATVADTVHKDPMFADAVNADFSLSETSELLTSGDDGKALGDLRWAPVVPSATIHYVSSDSVNVLPTAIDQAGSGDVIILTDAGPYLANRQMSLSKDITVIGDPSLPSPPVLEYIGTSTSAYFFKIPGDYRLVLKNLEFAGDGTGDGAAAKAKYVVVIDNGDTTLTAKLYVDGIIAHDFNDKFIKPYGSAGLDSLIVTNSIFYNGASEGIVLYSGSTSDPAAAVRYAEITNSTFHDIERECVKGDTYAYGKVIVDRITAYNCGDVDGKSMIYFDDYKDVTVTNSIFVKNSYSSYFARFESAENKFHHNAVWDVVNWTADAATVADTIHTDPMFADAANADFTLASSSPLQTFAEAGGPIGDPRWAPIDGKVQLNVFADGGGSVALNPPGGLYDPGTSVTMTATPDSMYVFDHWSDNVAIFPPNNPVATVTVNSNMNVTAYFVPTLDEYTITYDVLGLGHIDENLITNFPVEGYWEGDTLELTAVSDSATWVFVNWVNETGTEVSTDNPLVYPVTADAHFTAVFNSTLPQVSLDLTVVGSGNVAVSPRPVAGFTTYDQGQIVTLEAASNMGWEFGGYTGDVTETADSIAITMDANKTVTATFNEIPVPNGDLLVDASWDLRDAVEFAKYNSNVERIVLTEVGPYMPDESLRENGYLPNMDIDTTITIVASDTLSEKPVVKAWGEGSSEGIFRLRTNGHLTLKGLILDGYAINGKPTKYTVRADDGADMHCSFVAEDCDMFGALEVFWKNYPLSTVDSLILRGCTVSDIGKEGIYLKTVGDAKYIELTNTTFRRVNRQIIYLMTMAPEIVIDHVTIDSCGMGYGTEGAKFPAFRIENTTDVKITNTIIANIPFDAPDYTPYSLRIAGENSLIDNVLFFNAPTKLDLQDDAVKGSELYWYDPMFVRATNDDLTLGDSSVAYHLASDGSAAVGDLRWATSSSIADLKALDISTDGHGDVEASPAPMAKFYTPGTVVTLTATADTLYKFGSWSGDLTSANAEESVTMSADKSIMANFDEAFFTVELNVDMSVWADRGNFNVATDSVDIAGTMNGWGEVPMWMHDADGDTIHSYTLIVDENYPDLEWKFRINGSWNDATAEFPYGGPARTMTVVSDTSVTFWYNNDEPVAPGVMGVPDEFVLNQNYPNPFNPTTTIRFGLPTTEFTTVNLYDVTGRKVMTLIDGDMSAGYHDVVLNAAHLSSGLYFYSIKAGDFTAVKKLTLLK